MDEIIYIPVKWMGSIHLSDTITLHDVPYICHNAQLTYYLYLPLLKLHTAYYLYAQLTYYLYVPLLKFHTT